MGGGGGGHRGVPVVELHRSRSKRAINHIEDRDHPHQGLADEAQGHDVRARCERHRDGLGPGPVGVVSRLWEVSVQHYHLEPIRMFTRFGPGMR